MKTIDTKTKNEVLQVYDTWIQSYFDGVYRVYDAYLDDDFHFVGPSDEEEFLDRKQATKYLKKKSKLESRKNELRNQEKSITQYNKQVCITHLTDVWLQKDNTWVMNSRMRISSVLINSMEGWRFISQHCSKPTYKISSSGKKTIDIISEENIELKEALKRHSNQLEVKNKELELEASLEKVRSVAISLKKSEEMLDIAQVLYEQLLLLGFSDIRNAIIDIHNDDNETFLDYDYSREMLGTVTLMRHDDDPIIDKQFKAIVASTDAFFEIVLEGQELQDLIDLRLMNGEAEDPRLRKINQLTYNLYSFGNGAIGISNFGLLSETQKEILKRFRNVFTFTYKRYSDLAQAEKQSLLILNEKQRLEKTLSDLQATQEQLIQSEKMASLGELTAGIAHEIQNPLNFVNNFSDISSELIDEMNEEIEKGDLEEAKFIAADIKENLKKVNHHGKRADGIVKGMLQHSRKNTSEKEPTDINKLADEYLRLAYHGLRAKDKSFNATLVTEFDDSIENVKVFPQEIGRVILNLITNAFHACNERKKTSKDSDFEPTIIVKTERIDSPNELMLKGSGVSLKISVSDNGNGIPKDILDKIYQPFFTTKPSGEGTGLGLSMSYDIITKGHDGELKVETEEGKGTTFAVILPLLN